MYLTENGLSPSRAKAQEMIKNGCVEVNGCKAERPSFAVTESDTVLLHENPLQRYVGRGGLKLESALSFFSLSPKGQVALDIGASSGGFTDCLLHYGAKYVYAVDSGCGQLHPSLLSDPRVESREGVNARYLLPEEFPIAPSFAVMDVSFISQTLILPSLSKILPDKGTLVTLIKPQFELERSALSKGGVVKREDLRKRAVERVKTCALSLGFRFVGCMESPIKGGDGNVEYLAAFTVNKDENKTESEVNACE